MNKTIDVPYIRSGMIEDPRNWPMKVIGKHDEIVITSKVPYVGYVMGDIGQSRMSKLIGWRTVSKNLADNLRGALQRGNQAVNRWLKEKEAS